MEKRRAMQSHAWGLAGSAIASFLFSLSITAACYGASGVSLGEFFGPFILITFLVPALIVGEERLGGRLLVIGGLVLGTVCFWLCTANLSTLDLLRCGAVFGTYVFALAGIATAFRWCKCDLTFSAAMTVVVGFAWLTWPVWLNLSLAGSYAEAIVARLTYAHPLMALNGVLFDRFNSWDRYTLAYQQLTTLNQDVFYTLPRQITASVLLHGAIGTSGILLTHVWPFNHIRRRRAAG